MKRPTGYTLVELLIVVAIMSISAVVASVSIGPVLTVTEEHSEAVRLRMARREAIDSGRMVVVPSGPADSGATVLFLPDGRALGVGVDASTGQPE